MVDVATNPVIPGARQQTLGADRVIPGAGLLKASNTFSRAVDQPLALRKYPLNAVFVKIQSGVLWTYHSPANRT